MVRTQGDDAFAFEFLLEQIGPSTRGLRLDEGGLDPLPLLAQLRPNGLVQRLGGQIEVEGVRIRHNALEHLPRHESVQEVEVEPQKALLAVLQHPQVLTCCCAPRQQ